MVCCRGGQTWLKALKFSDPWSMTLATQSAVLGPAVLSYGGLVDMQNHGLCPRLRNYGYAF